MPFTVFLSYGNDPEEQVIAWRLQTLAAAHGIHVLVPQRNGFPLRPSKQIRQPGDDVRRMINQANCVLSIVTSAVSPATEAEIGYALSKHKIVVPIIREGIPLPPSLSKLPVFSFSPWNTGQVEEQVVGFLKRQRVSQQNQQTIGALVAIGLGLFLLAALAEK
jgi:TIR domain